MENPCGSQPLTRRQLRYGKLDSFRVPRPKRSRPFLPRMASTTNARYLLNCTPPHADSLSSLRTEFWYGMFGIPGSCSSVRTPSSVRRCHSPPMAVSSHAQLPNETFISGRSLPTATYFTEYSHPTLGTVPLHSSPRMGNRLSRSAVARSSHGAQEALPSLLPVSLPKPLNAPRIPSWIFLLTECWRI